MSHDAFLRSAEEIVVSLMAPHVHGVYEARLPLAAQVTAADGIIAIPEHATPNPLSTPIVFLCTKQCRVSPHCHLCTNSNGCQPGNISSIKHVICSYAQLPCPCCLQAALELGCVAAVPHHARRRPLGEGFDLAELQARPHVLMPTAALTSV